MKPNIGVIGLWHLGCVISVSWSKLGHNVVGFDYDSDRVNKLKDGIPPLYEQNLQESLQEGIGKKLLTFSSSLKDLSDCDFIFLSYDTPVRDDDSSDTSILEKSIEDVRSIIKNSAIVIVSSQSPVGYCKELRKLLKEYNKTLEIAYSPENLRLGEAIQCYLNPGRVILGSANPSTESKCLELFLAITNQVICMSLESAETVKHGINSFLALSIVYANSLADICEEKNARIDDVVRGIKSDPRIGEKAYLSPGIGFSGGTLGRDLKILEKINDGSNGFAKLFGFVHRSNNERKISIVNKLKGIIGDLSGKTIGVLGLTYKPGTSTLRRSLPLEIVELILIEKANVVVYDPKADYSELSYEPTFSIENSMEEIISKSDVFLILTDWPEFKTFDWEKNVSSDNPKIIFDAKNCLDESSMNIIGLKYYSIGRG